MVKADAKRNYYADLEVTPAADTEEIKRQFRKLARLYHPDRNPGKEVEYVPKFQAIQAAHEILSDPEQRAKYDADRRRLGHGAGGSRPAPPPRAGQTNFTGRSPYEAYSNFPPPRMRTNATPQRERPQSYAAPPSSSGPPPRPAGRPGFGPARGPPPPPPPRQPYAQDDTDARRNVFTAWEQMRHRQNQESSTWSDDDGLRKARAANDATKAHQSKPGLGRSHTTRVPRKGGFDPSARLSGDWEPAARSTSAYQSTPRPPRPTAPSPPPPTAHGEAPKARPTPLGQFRSKLSADDVPYMEAQRVRTPYASEGIGQKTYFNTEGLSRSTSMRDAPDLARNAGRQKSPRANAGRHRSASPIGRNPAERQTRRASVQPGARKNPAFNLSGYSDTESSSEEEPESPASDTSTKHMSGIPNGSKPRRTAKPGRFWQGRSDSPQKEQPSGSQTAGDATASGGNAGATPMYDSPFSTIFSIPGAYPLDSKCGGLPPYRKVREFAFTAADVSSLNLSPTYNKAPSSVGSRTTLQSKTSARQNAGSRSTEARRPSAAFPQYSLTPEQLAKQYRESRFSFSNVEDGSSAQPRSNSADDIDTGFNPNAWDGTFQGSTFSPPPVPPPGRGARRGSPPRRKPSRPAARTTQSTDNPADLDGTRDYRQAGSQNNPIDLTGFKVPPPPPFPPGGIPVPPGSAGRPPHSAGSSQGGVPLTVRPPSSGGFKSEEWLRKPTFFFEPPTEGRPPSPGKQAPTTTRKPKVTRPRKQSRGENNLKSHAESASDAGGEDSETIHKTKSAPPAIDSDAMDIDPEPALSSNLNKASSPRTTREPRLVPVQPTRPDWREGVTPPGAIPNVNGAIPPGTIPSAVPNAAVPPPPPPPPPPTSNTKQKRDASSTINFDSFHSTAPFAPNTNGGLSNLRSDLAGTLPFESQPSVSLHNQLRQLELPLPPKAPTPPLGNRIPQSLWREFMSSMAFYMGAYYQFEDKMITHFQARHLNARKFGTGGTAPLDCHSVEQERAEGMKLLEALGEASSGDGYAGYLRGLQEDVRVQKHWDVAREKHRDCIEGMLDFKKRIAMGHVKIVPDGFGGTT